MIAGPLIIIIGLLLTLTDHTVIAFSVMAIGLISCAGYIVREW